MTEIHVVPDFAGAQYGTKDNPFAAGTSAEFDALMRKHAALDQLAVHLSDGLFKTASTREWDDHNDVQLNPGFRVGRQWTIDLSPETVFRWDVDAVPDSEITDVPRWLFLSIEGRNDLARLNRHTPHDIWAMLPRGQRVRGGTIDLQFVRAAERWRAKGKTLQIGCGILAGHQPGWEGVRCINYGARGAENFPFYIQGGLGQYDRNLIAQLDPATHVFDDGVPDEECAHITDCTVDGYAEEATGGQQITARFIAGSTGERTPGEWVQHWRRFAYIHGGDTTATGQNLVQAACIYQCLRGDFRGGRHVCAVGYYGDSYGSRNVTIDEVDHEGYIAVQLKLAPDGACPEQYFHEGHRIGGNNRFKSTGPANVVLDTMGPSTSTRYIRDISVDASLTLENVKNGATHISRPGSSTPVPSPSPSVTKGKRGCLLAFSPF